MKCHYYEAEVCRSCTLLEQSYAAQLEGKDASVRNILRNVVSPSFFDDEARWHSPYASAEAGFRNKAKLVVGGSVSKPALGILGPDRLGRDLSECPLYEDSVSVSFPVLAEFIGRAHLTPFDVRSGRGELKNIIVTASPSGQLMIRYVLRSTESVVRIRKHLPWLQEMLPQALVVTANILPERKAVLEGKEEIFLTEAEALPIPLDGVTLYLRPQSFFQTNTAVARGLYQTAGHWVRDYSPKNLWDLYCGVGGFALHCAQKSDRARTRVSGVEISAQAVESARLAARETGIHAQFFAGDAYSIARDLGEPEFVIVNPPRRGIGDLASWLNESSGIRAVLYSSCNPVSLARDIATMSNFSPIRGQIFDMFPHTSHVETLVLMSKVEK